MRGLTDLERAILQAPDHVVLHTDLSVVRGLVERGLLIPSVYGWAGVMALHRTALAQVALDCDHYARSFSRVS